MRISILGAGLLAAILAISSLVLAVEPKAAGVQSKGSSTGQEEKLLLGFEPEEIEAFPKVLERKVTDGKDVEGRQVRMVEFPSRRTRRQWALYQDHASEGKFAAGLYYVRTPNVRPIPGWPLKRTAEFVNRDEVMHYFGMFTDHRSLFSTSGLHHLTLPADWSDYDLLRMDVYSQDLKLQYHVSFEDRDILPPVVRSMTAPAGEWVTLEIDLRAAAKGRGVDLGGITSLSVGVTDLVEGEPKFAKDARKRRSWPFARLDNIRLSRRGVAAGHRVVRDDRPYKLLAGYYLPATKPQPKQVTAEKPDHSPIKLGEPLVVKTSGRLDGSSRFNFIAAYDNNHLLVGYETARFWGTRALQTFDGGKSWRGLEGDLENIGSAKEKEDGPTPLRMKDFIDGGGWGEVIDSYGDTVIVTFGDSCGGPAAYHPRVFTRKLTFEGPHTGWTTRKRRALVDCEPRHCVASQSSFRDPAGRIWLAYGNLNRLNRPCISLRFSDDDAHSWRPLEIGKAGRIPGSMTTAKDEQGLFGFSQYTKQDPAPQLVPFGNGVACFWHNRRTPEHTNLYMARFDGQQWLPVETVPYPFDKRAHYTPRLHAVSVNGNEIFVLTTYGNGVLHYRDGTWKQELSELPAGLCRLSLAGDNRVILIAAIPEKDKLTKRGYQQQAPVEFRAWQRDNQGRWQGPRAIVKVEQPLDLGGALSWPAFRVPRFSPPNFVPLMWASSDHSLKILRVPVAQ